MAGESSHTDSDPVAVPETATGELRLRRTLEETLRRREAFEELLLGEAAAFVRAPTAKLDEELERALGRVGRFMGAERAVLWLLSEDGTRVSPLLGWSGSGNEEHPAAGPIPARRRPNAVDQL